MRKSSLVLLPLICGLQIVSAPMTADAYVYIYRPGVPAVQVDTSVLNGGASSQEQGTDSSSRTVEPSFPDETVQMAPVDPVESVPAQGQLQKPFFANVPLEAGASVAKKRQAHKQTSRPAPKKLAAPVFTAPAAEELPAPEAEQVSSLPAPVSASVAAPETKKAEAEPSMPAEETSSPAGGSVVDMSLEFGAAAVNLLPQAQEELNGMLKQLLDKPDMRVEIRGYAKGDDSDQGSARRMALSRALSVRSYLMEKGIQPVRLDVRALGSETDRMPIDRVDLVLNK